VTTFLTARVTEAEIRARRRFRQRLNDALRIVLADIMRTEGFQAGTGHSANHVWCNVCKAVVGLPCPPGVQEFEDSRDQLAILRKWTAAVEATLAKHVCDLGLSLAIGPQP
jgi:hypothetical protein